jgi:hypothetical protein
MTDDDAPIPHFSIVPALPGWHVAIFIAGGSEDGEAWDPYFTLEPIIAWMIEHHRYHSSARRPPHERAHHVDPITVEGTQSTRSSNPWAYKKPDGRFDFPAGESFDTEMAALKYAQWLLEQGEAEKPSVAARA